MNGHRQIILELKDYFKAQNSVVLAFVFGSRAKKTQRPSSDWDIALYFKTGTYAALEDMREYPDEHTILEEIEHIVKSDEIDLVVLNRAKPSLVFSILNSGVPLTVKDRKLYLKLLMKAHYEAVDYWNFTREFYEIVQRSSSLSGEDRSTLREHIRSLDNEFDDLKEFQAMSTEEYVQHRDKRRNVERWVENLVMSAIDIAKIVLASEKKDIPQTYRETLLYFSLKIMDEHTAKRFSQFAEMRNIVAHEYIEMRWERIKKFIRDASKLYPAFIKSAKKYAL